MLPLRVCMKTSSLFVLALKKLLLYLEKYLSSVRMGNVRTGGFGVSAATSRFGENRTKAASAPTIITIRFKDNLRRPLSTLDSLVI